MIDAALVRGAAIAVRYVLAWPLLAVRPDRLLFWVSTAIRSAQKLGYRDYIFDIYRRPALLAAVRPLADAWERGQVDASIDESQMIGSALLAGSRCSILPGTSGSARLRKNSIV